MLQDLDKWTHAEKVFSKRKTKTEILRPRIDQTENKNKIQGHASAPYAEREEKEIHYRGRNHDRSR